MFKKIVSHFFLTLTVFVLLMVPDIIFTLWKNPSFFMFRFESFIKQFIVLELILFFTLAIPQKKVRFSILLLLALFVLFEQLHFVYFHSYIKPYELKLFFQEQDEIWDTISEIYQYFILPIALFLIQILLLLKITKKAPPLQFKIALPITLVLLLLGPVVAHKRKNMYVFMPKNTSISITNMYTTLSWFLGHELFKKEKPQHYNPYRVIKLKGIQSPQTVIFVMGESLSSKRMSLFGFDKETTPNLDTLRSSPNFYFNWGYSCGVCTKVSVPTFFTLKAEPHNMAPLINNVTNLTRLAKSQGYHVYYITMQSSMLLSGYISAFTDKIVEMKGYDEELLKALNKIDFSQKNFIILHQRNSHSPYARYTPKRFQKFPFKEKPYHDYMVNSYLNSVLYSDYIISQVFKKVQELNSSAIAFATSDHGELLGMKDEHGQYGHNMLDPEVAKVPLLVYINDRVDASIKNILKNFKTVHSHYQFGKLVATVLGYKVINPNEHNDTLYINGTNLLGESGYMIIHPSTQKVSIKR